MTTPADLKYSQSHEWVRLESDGTATIGITFHAQEQLGDVVFVQNPDVGRKLAQGEECGVIESVKAAADIYSPLSGEVVAANSALETAPQNINEEPYSAWLFKLKLSDPGELAGLLDAAAYDNVAAEDKN
ncbi:MAG: glycine cleavage system protein GcvH [Betaproteobacteria bacterium]|nr:MAG: glycine cleavage system protein GcvH [Betaproteobacteria bacterium]